MRSSWHRKVAPGVLLMASLTLSGPGRGAFAPAAAAVPAATMTVVGDIDGCNKGEDTAELAATIPGPIATVGDNAYPDGTAAELARCYAPTWGKLKDRTHPIAGNHDYDTARAKPYYDYFGAAAGDPTTGWYSYNVGAWHIVALNSNCEDVDCAKQVGWLESDLVANPSACIMAYWHHPRFTSGTSGGDSAVGPFWNVLYKHGATLVFSGHDHDYERFAPQNPSGRADPKGIRQFVVGTGGATLGSLSSAAPNSEVRSNRAYGVLQLTLRADGYDWNFAAIDDGDDFRDSGSDTCKGTAPAAQPSPVPAPPIVEPTTPPAPPEEEPAPPSSQPGPTSPPATATDPNTGKRRPTKTSPTTAAPPRKPPASPASGSSKPKARSVPATRPAAPVTTTPTTAAPVAPSPDLTAAPPAPVDEVAVGAPPEGPPPISVLALPGQSGYHAGSGSGSEESDPLALAIGGLINQSSPAGPPGPDRRNIALAAVFLLIADGAAIAVLRRRASGGSFSCLRF